MSVNGLGGNYRNVSSNAGRTAVPGAAPSAGAVTGAGGVTVEISDGARAASAQAAAAPSFKDVGMAARARLDALKQQAAEKTGTTAGAVNLNRVDYSSFSDQDLAAMHLNSSGNFSRDEQNQAQGVLGERMRVSLEACRGFTDLGDRRGHAMTIDALYATMMAANDSMLAGDEEKFGKLPVSGILANLQATQVTGGLIFQAGHLWHGADAASDDYRQYCL